MRVAKYSIAVILVLLTALGGIYAYLQDEVGAVNTFTVGNVHIAVDESKVDQMGNPVGGRVISNTYKLLPGYSYTKDPTLRVLNGSSEAYVKMEVEFTNSVKLRELLKNNTAEEILTLLNGLDNDVWEYKGYYEQGDSVFFAFNYTDVAKVGALEPLFTSFSIPGYVDGKGINDLKGFEIRVKGYAIQKAGFASAEDAFQALEDTQ